MEWLLTALILIGFVGFVCVYLWFCTPPKAGSDKEQFFYSVLAKQLYLGICYGVPTVTAIAPLLHLRVYEGSDDALQPTLALLAIFGCLFVIERLKSPFYIVFLVPNALYLLLLEITTPEEWGLYALFAYGWLLFAIKLYVNARQRGASDENR